MGALRMKILQPVKSPAFYAKHLLTSHRLSNSHMPNIRSQFLSNSWCQVLHAALSSCLTSRAWCWKGEREVLCDILCTLPAALELLCCRIINPSMGECPFVCHTTSGGEYVWYCLLKRFPWVVFSRNLSCLFSRRESVTKITPSRKAFWERGLCLPCSFQGKLFGRREEVVKSLFTKLETKIPSVYINKRENGLVVWAHGCN